MRSAAMSMKCLLHETSLVEACSFVMADSCDAVSDAPVDCAASYYMPEVAELHIVTLCHGLQP